jgi:hypothetical protein
VGRLDDDEASALAGLLGRMIDEEVDLRPGEAPADSAVSPPG